MYGNLVVFDLQFLQLFLTYPILSLNELVLLDNMY
jgi:hypothetical protein